MTLEELRAQRRREDLSYHRSQLDRFGRQLEEQLELFRTAAEELGDDSVDATFDTALQHLATAAGEVESALNAVRRAREALA